MEIPKCSSTLTTKLGINAYELVTILSKRAKELILGSHPLVENKSTNFVDIALSEIVEDKIRPNRKEKETKKKKK